MKKSKYPRLRTKIHRGKNGQVWAYYRYDMRGTGKPDIQLGTDFAKAIEKWSRIHTDQPQAVGRLQEAIDRFRHEYLEWDESRPPKYDNAKTIKDYTRQLRNVEEAMGHMAWHEITLPVLRQYLDARSAKTQGNREMAVLSIVWGKARLWGMTQTQWPAAGVKSWKNAEQAREFEVTDALFAAVYEQADQVLKDCMDIATTTGMRLTDVRTCRMPVDGKLRFRAGKTSKWAYFEVSESPVLMALLARRGQANCVTLLCTSTGKVVSERMLRTRYDEARERAAAANPELADQIRAMYLRDSRKRAADLADDMNAASALLQHSSTALTAAHYRTKATKLKAVR